MKTKEIYKKYSIPLNLQRHMLTVTALGQVICEACEMSEIDKDLVVKSLLVHDLGNILKFDFKNLVIFDGNDRDKVGFYQQVQNQMKIKYGEDPDVATLKISEELGLDKRISLLCDQMHWNHGIEFINTNKWNEKVCMYADMRVAPNGLVRLKERFDDLMVRRSDRKEEELLYFGYGKKIEKEIQSVCKVDLQTITNEELVSRGQFLPDKDIS